MGRQKKTKHNEMRKVLKFSRLSLLGFSSLGVLGLLVLAMILPMSSSNTNALDNAMDIAETRVKVKAAASVSLALADQVELDITPSSAGSFASASTRLSVTTNNPEGYKLFLSTKNGNNALLGAAAEISSITSDKTGNEFSQEGDVWGYSLTQGETTPDISSTYHQVPTTAILAYDQDTATTVLDEHHYNLGFGVHVTPSLLAGEYSNSVVVSVVANPNTLTRLDQLVYMQDMTSAICEATPSAYNHDTSTVDRDSPYYLEPVTKQLYDIRDGNMYWVAKLADGNCWMTQNLALNLGERPVDAPASYSRYVKTLTPGDSDVVSEWTVPASTTKYKVYDNPTNPMEPLDPEHPENTPIIEKTETITGTEVAIPRKDIRPNGEQANDTRSWNLGKIVSKNPTGSKLCSGTLPTALATLGYTASGSPNSATAYYSQNPIGTCQWFQEVGGLTASNEPIATATNTIVGDQYDSHYLIGNYYEWKTAVANMGGSSSAAGLTDETELNDYNTTTQSICPKGWRLPVSGRSFTKTNNVVTSFLYDREDSFYRLLRAYNYPENTNMGQDSATQWKIDVHENIVTNLGKVSEDDLSQRIRVDFAPIYLVRTGLMQAHSGALTGLGDRGELWSSTIYPAISYVSFNMHFTTSSAVPALRDSHNTGYSVRCLAR